MPSNGTACGWDVLGADRARGPITQRSVWMAVSGLRWCCALHVLAQAPGHTTHGCSFPNSSQRLDCGWWFSPASTRGWQSTAGLLWPPATQLPSLPSPRRRATRILTAYGARVVAKLTADVTHVVVLNESSASHGSTHRARCVASAWLDACHAKQAKVAEEAFIAGVKRCAPAMPNAGRFCSEQMKVVRSEAAASLPAPAEWLLARRGSNLGLDWTTNGSCIHLRSLPGYRQRTLVSGWCVYSRSPEAPQCKDSNLQQASLSSSCAKN